ncbi:extracellular ribonuclease [Marinomonas sp. MED121]|uniref:endonuclease n=1 Tax=Marinomonas sp. MED121 TaxID=314277 RepID=UPI0000690BC4|nr:endonuclease [Marinomonas sp. MED121]EAQ65863.1 extracellular ribonuclease [Marinomonas sp. MED121]
MKAPMTSLLLFGSSFGFAELQISEVLYDTPGTDSSEEWVEIFNPGCDVVDLSSYQLKDNGSTYSLSGTLAANTYLTLARSSSGFEALYGFAPDASDLTLSLGNSGDYLELYNANTLVDLVAWEGKVSGWDLSAKYVSLYRTNISSSTSESDWATSSIDTPSTGNLSQDCSGNNGSGEGVSYSGDYYDSVTNLSGASLKAALQDLLEVNHTKLSYSEVWDALQYTDEDPDNTSNVILLYTRRSHDKSDRDGQTGFDNQSWNREHVWPKSLGFASTSQYGYTDIHHIRPADKTVNSSRSNKDYDEGGSAQGEAADTYATSESFEPMDDIKGDVARMIFYMDVRYDGSDGNMSDLYLVNNTSSETGDSFFGVICTLYTWHQEDAVDANEMRRNDRIQEWQGNRNPLIDHPEWVAEFYSGQCG